MGISISVEQQLKEIVETQCISCHSLIKMLLVFLAWKYGNIKRWVEKKDKYWAVIKIHIYAAQFSLRGEFNVLVSWLHLMCAEKRDVWTSGASDPRLMHGQKQSIIL